MTHVFLDIETIAETSDFANYNKKSVREARYCGESSEAPEVQYQQRANLHAEFGRIVCISCVLRTQGGEIKKISFCSDDERSLLSDFFEMINKAWVSVLLWGHNVKSFDIPFICKRGIINGLKIPKALDYGTLPAWKMGTVIDTMEMRQRSGYLRTGLELLCLCLGVPSPKQSLEGSQISDLYWNSYKTAAGTEDHRATLQTIASYCEGDALASLLCYEKMAGIEVTEPVSEGPKEEKNQASLLVFSEADYLTWSKKEYMCTYKTFDDLMAWLKQNYSWVESYERQLRDQWAKYELWMPF